jgi:hypothetical protein
MRGPEFIVKATEQNGMLIVCFMGEDAKEFFGQRMLLNAVMVIKTGLARIDEK